jgi:plasmid stability protein
MVNLPEGFYQQLRAYAAKMGMSDSAAVRMIVFHYLRELEKKPDDHLPR